MKEKIEMAGIPEPVDDELEMFHALEQIPMMVEKMDSYHSKEVRILEEILKMAEDRGTTGFNVDHVASILGNHVSKSLRDIEYKLPNIHQLADKIAASLSPIMREILIRSIDNIPITIEHKHVFVTELWKYAGEKAKWVIKFLAVTSIILLLSLFVEILWFYNSNAHWNCLYEELIRSDTLSETEINELKRLEIIDSYSIEHPLCLFPKEKKKMVEKYLGR